MSGLFGSHQLDVALSEALYHMDRGTNPDGTRPVKVSAVDLGVYSATHQTWRTGQWHPDVAGQQCLPDDTLRKGLPLLTALRPGGLGRPG